jgi:hypothetical protein
MEVVECTLGSLGKNIILESLFGSLQSLSSIGKLQVLADLGGIT